MIVVKELNSNKITNYSGKYFSRFAYWPTPTAKAQRFATCKCYVATSLLILHAKTTRKILV